MANVYFFFLPVNSAAHNTLSSSCDCFMWLVSSGIEKQKVCIGVLKQSMFLLQQNCTTFLSSNQSVKKIFSASILFKSKIGLHFGPGIVLFSTSIFFNTTCLVHRVSTKKIRSRKPNWLYILSQLFSHVFLFISIIIMKSWLYYPYLIPKINCLSFS